MACELLHRPLQRVVLGHVDRAARGRVEAGRLHVLGDGHEDVDVVGDALLLVVALDLDDEADLGVGGVLDDHVHREERLHADVQPVAHELELAVGRDEGDQSLVLEAAEAHALVELDVVELHGLVLAGPALRLIVGLVVEAELEVGHAGELAVSVDHTDDLALDDVVGGANQHRQLLHHVQEELVLGVLDALLPPGYHIGHLPGSIDGAVEFLLLGEGVGELVGLGLDEALEELDLGGLRVAVVHHFVEQFVDDDEVVADGLLLDVLEVALEDGHEGVEEGEDEDCVVIFLGDGDEVEVVVLVEVEEVVVLVLDEGPMWGRKYLRVYSSYSRIFLLKTS